VIVNEVLQWIALSGVAVLTLGVFRQITLMLPPQARATPSGPPTGSRAPRRLVEALKKSGVDGALQLGVTVAFVTENCTGCQRLLANLGEQHGNGNAGPTVLVAYQPTPQFRMALEEVGLPLIVDEGELWEACDVTATPLVVHINERGRVAMKEVTHRVESVGQVAA
jgi:hypothetical protein